MKNAILVRLWLIGTLLLMGFTTYCQITTIQRISVPNVEEFVVGSHRIPVSERNDTTLFFDLEKAAFRVGEMKDSGWVRDSVGRYSFAAGFNARAKGNASTAFGNHTVAFGSNSIAMGFESVATSDALAIGRSSRAMGRNSIALGTSNISSGNLAASLGNYLHNSSYGSVVIGRYNVGGGNKFDWLEEDPLFEIGNGSTENNRSNALIILKSGKSLFGKTSNILTDRVSINSVQDEDALSVQVDNRTKFKVYSNGSISLGTDNGGVSDDDVYIHQNLGMGISVPEKKLDVRGGAQIKMNSGSTNGPQLTLHETSTTDYARLYFQNNNPETYWALAGRPSSSIANSTFNFYLDGVGNIMSLRGSGRVGIGTSIPSQKLEVNGAVKLGNSEGTPQNGTLRYGSNGLEVFDNDEWNVVLITPKKLEIGDEAYGGIIFWLDEKGEHGLVASMNDLSQNYKWSESTGSFVGADGTGIYAGERNSSIMIATYPGTSTSNTFAAKACQNFNGGGYGDWYLPSSSEFFVLRAAAASHSNITLVGDYYWTSNERINDTIDPPMVEARAIHGTAGDFWSSKNWARKVRPIRAF